MLAAVTVATAYVLEGAVADGVALELYGSGAVKISVEHPTGEFSVELEVDPEQAQKA